MRASFAFCLQAGELASVRASEQSARAQRHASAVLTNPEKKRRKRDDSGAGQHKALVGSASSRRTITQFRRLIAACCRRSGRNGDHVETRQGDMLIFCLAFRLVRRRRVYFSCGAGCRRCASSRRRRGASGGNDVHRRDEHVAGSARRYKRFARRARA